MKTPIRHSSLLCEAPANNPSDRDYTPNYRDCIPRIPSCIEHLRHPGGPAGQAYECKAKAPIRLPGYRDHHERADEDTRPV